MIALHNMINNEITNRDAKKKESEKVASPKRDEKDKGEEDTKDAKDAKKDDKASKDGDESKTKKK